MVFLFINIIFFKIFHINYIHQIIINVLIFRILNNLKTTNLHLHHNFYFFIIIQVLNMLMFHINHYLFYFFYKSINQNQLILYNHLN